MATAREENPYEGGGFGKFRKRPFRRAQTTPYDRSPTSLRNPSRSDSWFSKVVDPAQRLIASSAHKFFSVFRKRLTAPSPPPPSAERVQQVGHNHQEAAVSVANGSSGYPLGVVGDSAVQINYSEGGGLTELEKLLKQNTFTRSEIDRLTALMHSRTVDSPVGEEEKRPKVVPFDPMLLGEQKEDYSKTPALENGIENHLVSIQYAASSDPIEDVASPAELAKAYMGSRPSKVSHSILGLRSVPREDPTLLKSQHLTQKSRITSIVPRATTIGRVHENGFVNPRSRGRSAIYSVARTPYARVYPASMLKGVGVAGEGEPSSSAQYALDHDMLSGSKQGALKRRSSVLDNDIGSVGPIRRIRQRPNLLSSKGLTLPHSSSPMSIARSGVGIDASLQPSSSGKKPLLLGEVKRSPMKLSADNVDDTVPSTSFPRLPSKSSEMASKILQQLDKLASPKEKSSAFTIPSMNDKSPLKLSLSMLQGQALRSMQTVDSSKFLDNKHDRELDVTNGNSLANGQKVAKVQNSPLKLVGPSNGLVPVATDSATVPRKRVISIGKSEDSSVTNPVSFPPQKKRAFHMSAHEDYLELEDDAYPNGGVSPLFTSGKQTVGSTSVAEKTTCVTENTVQEMPLASSVVIPSRSKIDSEPLGTADGSIVDAKVNVLNSKTSSIPDHTSKLAVPAVTEATHTILGSNKIPSSNGSVANPNLFNFGSKVVAPTELTAADAPSKESTKSGPVFGLKKIDSSTSGANVPLVKFGINKNVDNVPQVPFNFSSSVGGESSALKFGASSDSKLRSSNSPTTTIAGVADSKPEVLESLKVDAKTNVVTGFSTPSSEPAVSSAASTSSLPTNIFTFGNSSSQNNGPVSSMLSFSSPFPPMVTNCSNIFSNSSLAASTSNINVGVASTNTTMTTSTSAVISSSNSSSTTVMTSLSPTIPFFKFGAAPSPSTGLPLSSTFGSEPADTKGRQDAGIGNLGRTFGSSSAASGSTGSGIFGFSSSALSTINNQSQGSIFGTTSGSVIESLAPPATSVFATSVQSQLVGSGSAASSPLFGSIVNPAFSSASSLFPSSSNATNILSSGTTFGQSNPASSEANPVSSVSSTTFGLSSWQPSKAPFGSAFSSSASSTSGFPFGTSTPSVACTSSPLMFGSSSSVSSGPQFSFTSAAATTNVQNTLGSPSPVFAFGSASTVNNDQMGMEDSMAEDTVQATPPVAPVFSQQPAQLQSNFLFGASTSTPTPTGASPFQFASQQNIAPQSPSPFQASGSVEFNSGGGGFSLGSGGGDKSGRKFVRVSRKPRKK